MKASKEIDRRLKWKEAEIATNKLELEIERTRAEQRRTAASAETEVEMAKLEKLEAMGVDLTQYLVSQQRGPADKDIRITNESSSALHTHMHVDDCTPRSPR